MSRASESDSLVFITLMCEHLLQDAEQAITAWNGHDHGAQLPQYLLPFGVTDSLLMGCDRVQDFEETSDVVGCKFIDRGKCANGPTQDHLLCGPCGIAFAHFLQRCRLLVMRVVVGFQTSKDSIQGMQKRSLNMLPMFKSNFGHANETININVPLLRPSLGGCHPQG
jgi:hypothetical protein